MRRATRILSIALITAGLVILADVGLTLTWNEPISALYTKIKQSAAEDQLDELIEKKLPADLRAAAREFNDRLEEGKGAGRIEIPRIGLRTVFVEGTDTESLRTGPGHYDTTALPGQERTVAIAGHRTTYGAPFRELNELERGDEIEVEMGYGTFTYSVIGHRIVTPDQTEVIDDVGSERLVLTACHPLYSAAERYVVTARLESSRA